MRTLPAVCSVITMLAKVKDIYGNNFLAICVARNGFAVRTDHMLTTCEKLPKKLPKYGNRRYEADCGPMTPVEVGRCSQPLDVPVDTSYAYSCGVISIIHPFPTAVLRNCQYECPILPSYGCTFRATGLHSESLDFSECFVGRETKRRADEQFRISKSETYRAIRVR